MSYIVVASFQAYSEKVAHDWRERLTGAGILSERGGTVKVDVRGDHMRTAEIVKQLCDALIAAGIYEFEIRHSY